MTLRDKIEASHPEVMRAAKQRYAVVKALAGIEVWVGFRDEAGDDDSASGTLDTDSLREVARALDAAGLLVDTAHDAAVAARAWDEGHTAGVRNASAEFDGPVQDNPYEREGATMRSAEEVAREVLGCRLTLADDGRNVCETEHGGVWDCTDEEQRIADLIRARDAEVRAATLAGFTEERDTHHRVTRVPCDCEHPMHARLLGDDSPPTHVTAVPVRVRRYVTPWEPEP